MRNKHIYFIVIASFLLPLFVFTIKYNSFEIKAQTVTPANTYTYFKSLVTKTRNLSPVMVDKEELIVDCSADYLHAKWLSNKKASLVCGKKVPKATGTPTPTGRVVTVTTVPSATKMPTHAMTSTPTSNGGTNPGNWSTQMGRWAPNTLFDTCTKEQHDTYNVIGPDGKVYPTWHPPLGPNGCRFGHEHGADPRLAKANNTMPAFGYAAELMGMIEPHAGFKISYINKGESFMEGAFAKANYRIVLHMGTAGINRFVQQFHSFQYDYIADDGTGRYFHIYGMGDTGNGTGSTCTNPRDGGKDFSTVGCQDPYEIWNAVSFVIHRPDSQFPTELMQNELGILFSMAAFDPITTRDPNDNSRLLYSQVYYYPNNTADPASPQGAFQGCSREVYGGPNYFKNSGRSTVYYTDVYGTIKQGPAAGLIKQEVSAVTATTNEQFKFRQDFCGNGIHAPN